jgi:hypothetical protein
LWRYRWTGLRDRARGGGELVSVATSGLAIIAADLGLVGLAIGLLVLAICIYCLMTGVVLWRAVHEPTAVELRQPDVWILMVARRSRRWRAITSIGQASKRSGR